MTDPLGIMLVIVSNFCGIVLAHLVARVKIEHRLTELETKIDYATDAINALSCNQYRKMRSRAGKIHRHGFAPKQKAC